MNERLDDLTARCIRCGFCLESCPTFVLTGQETDSPRGRIYLARSAEAGKIPWAEVREPLDKCLGCRACEPACPSGVAYGSILEMARARLEQERPNRSRRVMLSALTNNRRLRALLKLARMIPTRRMPGFVSRWLSGQAAEADLPQRQSPSGWPPLQEAELPAVRGEVLLLEGCAMRELFPRVHEATRRLLRRAGYVVSSTGSGCCGALHAHSGHLKAGLRMAETCLAALNPDQILVVNSAGCGSFLKDTKLAEGQVKDISEFLVEAGLDFSRATALPSGLTATYHDACHLAHGQRLTAEPRALLKQIPGVEWRPLFESDTCCGSAGTYNLTQPGMARRLLERKRAHIDATGADLVVLGNPGCHAWIAQAARERSSPWQVMHTAELLESAFSGLPEGMQLSRDRVGTGEVMHR